MNSMACMGEVGPSRAAISCQPEEGGMSQYHTQYGDLPAPYRRRGLPVGERAVDRGDQPGGSEPAGAGCRKATPRRDRSCGAHVPSRPICCGGRCRPRSGP